MVQIKPNRQERFLYEVSPRRPMRGILKGRAIVTPTTLQLDYDEVLECMKYGMVHRRFTNRIERVLTTNIDRLHRKEFISEESYKKLLASMETSEPEQEEEVVPEETPVVEPEKSETSEESEKETEQKEEIEVNDETETSEPEEDSLKNVEEEQLESTETSEPEQEEEVVPEETPVVEPEEAPQQQENGFVKQPQATNTGRKNSRSSRKANKNKSTKRSSTVDEVPVGGGIISSVDDI